MECDLEILHHKLEQISRAILTKECMLEEVLLDIQGCGYGWEETWEALRKACSGLKCSRLKGRVGAEGEKVFLEVPILSDLASLIAEVMAGALGVSGMEGEVLVEKSHHLLLPEANRSFSGSSIEVSLSHVRKEEKSWSIDVNLLKAPPGFSLPISTRVVLARLI